MHVVRDINKLESKKVPIVGKVTAFASSKGTGFEAYGLNNGTIFLLDKQKKIHRLTGHRSRISKIKINGSRLYSSSYDGTVNLWMANSEKIEPMTLVTSNNWIMFFTFDPSKNYLWTAGQKGDVSEILISPQAMFDKLQKKIIRDMSQEEWNYYIGRNVPYESFLAQRRKGVRL
jgi:WD40 repeat protein